MNKKNLKKVICIIYLISACYSIYVNIGMTEIRNTIEYEKEDDLARSIIGWRYKMIDGQLYRRQYNYTEECWIGEWEPFYG